MNLVLPDRQKLLQEVPLTLGLNLLIGLFLTALNFGGPLAVNVIISECIGSAIYGCVTITYLSLAEYPPAPRLVAIAAAIGVGAGLGFTASTFITGFSLLGMFRQQGVLLLQILVISLLFGVVVSYFFISKQRLAEIAAQAREEKIQRLAQEKLALTMQLKLLQAQIEPHFLFNTLSNLESLLDSDVTTARRLLANLSSYLRTTLERSREGQGTLAQEMKIVRAYLAIQQIRMGARLTFMVNLPEVLADLRCPPLLIQPLVENAVRHGLEPSVTGGEVVVDCRKEGERIRIEVRDSGVGFAGGQPGTGTNNVRERLQALFGAEAGLSLAEVSPRGVKALVEYPDV
ncbi:MAG: histidine kinase [Desulfobulbaceae bacterium]|nr:histidine kinase [Desulfobulbaceae bacterium]